MSGLPLGWLVLTGKDGRWTHLFTLTWLPAGGFGFGRDDLCRSWIGTLVSGSGRLWSQEQEMSLSSRIQLGLGDTAYYVALCTGRLGWVLGYMLVYPTLFFHSIGHLFGDGGSLAGLLHAFGWQLMQDTLWDPGQPLWAMILLACAVIGS